MPRNKPYILTQYDGAKEIPHGSFPSRKLALLHTRNNDIKYYIISPDINPTIKMKIQLTKGRTRSTIDKSFANDRHKSNYIALMQRKGYKVEVFDDTDNTSVFNHDKAFIEAYENEMVDNIARSIGA